MQNAETLNADQIGEFLKLRQEIKFTGQGRAEVYRWVQRVLVAQEYAGQGKNQRGAIRAYIAKVTGRSLPQVTRLVRMYRTGGTVEPKPYRRRRFPRHYTDQDIALLAEVDRAHERLSGPATRCILKREHEEFGKRQYARLAGISIAHLYNLRHSARYRKQAAVFEPTRPSAVSIGERRKPDPQGRAGFLRVDTVHQGDWDGAKGVYHINAVDTVTQWQVVGCVSKISERHLLPVLEAMLHQFPFRILGFHADNGSEYINHTVAKLLAKLRIELTKSRPRHSNDNGLAETKNGAIVRKHFGYAHLPQRAATQVNTFCQTFLNPYVNFHRPCFFPDTVTSANGKTRKRYLLKDMRTPYEQLKAVPHAEQILKTGVTFATLDRIAAAMSDNEAARRLNEARAQLFQTFHPRSEHVA